MSAQDDLRIRQRRLLESFAEAVLDDPQLRDEILREAGLSADALAEDGAALARELYGAARLHHAAVQRSDAERTVAQLRDRVVARLRAAGADVRAELARLLGGGDAAELQAYFRKVDSLSDEDAFDMLTEAQLLRLLDEAGSDDLERGDASEGDG